MKKPLLIATSTLLGLTAMAVTPIVSEEVSKAFSVEDLKTCKETNTPMFRMESNQNANGRAKVVSPDGNYNMYPVMQMPSTPFYMGGLTQKNPETGVTMSIAPFPVAPNIMKTYTGVTYVGKAVSTAPAFSSWDDFNYSWDYVDFYEGVKKTATGETLTMSYPAENTLGGWVIPEVTMTYGTLTEKAPNAPYSLIIGGQGYYPLTNSASGVLEASYVGYNTVAMIDGLLSVQGDSPFALFGSTKFSNEDKTYEDGSNAWLTQIYGSAFAQATGEDMVEGKTTAIGFNLPYGGSPYLLSKLTLFAWSNLTNEVPLKIEVYEANEKGQYIGDPLYVYEYKCVASVNNPNYTGNGVAWREEIPISFSSKDEDGLSINYVVIDKPLFVKITGFASNESVKVFQPWCSEYNAKATHKYCQDLPATACVLSDLYGETKKLSNIKTPLDTYIFTDGTNSFFNKSFYVKVEAEYPYLEPTQVFVGDAETSADVNYAADGNYSFEVPTGTKTVVINVATSADDFDAVVVDDEDLPAGVKVVALDGVGLLQSSRILNIIQLQFDLDESFVNKSATLPLSYKNLKTNITLYNGTANVSDITVDENAAPVYYDLQGRKVVGTPEKGIYIVKQGNKVNKVVL